MEGPPALTRHIRTKSLGLHEITSDLTGRGRSLPAGNMAMAASYTVTAGLSCRDQGPVNN
jgi:hypothetical protein